MALNWSLEVTLVLKGGFHAGNMFPTFLCLETKNGIRFSVYESGLFFSVKVLHVLHSNVCIWNLSNILICFSCSAIRLYYKSPASLIFVFSKRLSCVSFRVSEKIPTMPQTAHLPAYQVISFTSSLFTQRSGIFDSGNHSSQIFIFEMNQIVIRANMYIFNYAAKSRIKILSLY